MRSPPTSRLSTIPVQRVQAMTPLGKPLVFHLKYMAEMNRLYGHGELLGVEPDLTGLDNAEKVREMARTVGAAAYEQAADCLELCGKSIEEHFTGLGIAAVANKTKRTTVVNNWYWRARVRVPSVDDGWFACGVSITAPPEVRISLDEHSCGIVVPWLWARGGHKG